MTLLQPHLGDTRHQELRNSPFWPSSLFKSQLVEEGEDFLLKKAPLKTHRVWRPIKTSPFVVPTTRKEAPTGNTPVGATPPKAVINRFPQSGGNRTTEAPEVIFDLIPGGEGMETPPPKDSSIASLSPPVGGRLRSFRRDWQINKMFRQRIKHYHQWLRSAIHLKTKIGQSSPDSFRLRGPSQKTSSGLLHPVSSVKERNRKGGKCKISRVLQSPVSSPQASPKVEASDRPKQAQRLPTCRKVQNGNTRVHQGLSDSRGMGVVDRLRCLPSHPHPPKLKEVPKVLPEVFQFTSLPFRLATAPQVFTTLVKEVKLMALTRGIRLFQYLDDWLIRAQSQEEAQVNTQTVVDLTQSLGWILNQEKSELKHAQVFPLWATSTT